MAVRIESRARFDIIRYANCWEDADILCEALGPAPGKRFLSVASGGDNSLALAAGGAEVIAVDISGAQLACLELKRAAIRVLGHGALLGFLGIRPDCDRLNVYAALRDRLPEESRTFWDARRDLVERGLVHAGRFERFFRVFRRFVLPLVHGEEAVASLLEEKPLAARQEFYRARWNNVRWRLVFRIFFSRFVLGRAGRDPEFFRYVRGSVAGRILARTEHALTVLPTHGNPYLEFILLGNYQVALPRYLREEHFEGLRRGVELLTTVRGGVEAAAGRYGKAGFDGYNLSDIFEYLPPETCGAIYRELLESARAGARFVYWNMLAPRSCPEALAGRVRRLEGLADELYARDRAFFYSALRIEEAA